MSKPVERYYRIGEVAALLGETQHTLRYWEDAFSWWVRPTRTAKGQRVYSARHVAALAVVKRLTRVEGLTLRGARRVMLGRSEFFENRTMGDQLQ
jgi:DNA-binding transcriptional MerR regulator